MARRARGRRVALLLLAGVPNAAVAMPPVSGEAVPLENLPGFLADDHVAGFAAFRAGCRAAVGASTPLHPAIPPTAGLRSACAAALAMRLPVSDPVASAFFVRRFEAHRVAAPAFITGYYEPVVDASPVRTEDYGVPLLAAPSGLVAAGPGEPWRFRRADGVVAALPDRAAIETGALGSAAHALAFVREPVDAFFVQVQGSARLRFPDGTTRRLAYAGRNGYPYTAIGKVLVASAGIPPDKLGMDELKLWIRAHGQKPGDAGAALMARNRSFIFFRFDDALPPDAGPVGAAGQALIPLRTAAIDRTVWSYGLPFVVEAALPWRTAEPEPFKRMVVAADTGAAIVGPARVDLFVGTGSQAGALAGRLRHPGDLYVLWPKGDALRADLSAHPAP